MKKILLTITILILFLLSCGKKEVGENSEVKKIKVGLESTYAPFEYKVDGKLVGFDIDLVEELGKSLGFEVEFIEQSFDGLIPALKAGKIDLIASGLSETEERKKSVDFTDTYYKAPNLFLRKKGNDKIFDRNSMKGKKIGVQLGTIQEGIAKTIEGALVVPNESTITILTNLVSGRLDVVILDGIVALEYMKNYTELEAFLEEENEGNGMAMAVDKGKYSQLIEKINLEMKKMKEDGRYKAILDKYNLVEPIF